MLTPQQVQEIRFARARHGYDMQAVDESLGALVQDYLTLYKDNSVLKSKMRVLVEKLEEYRNQEKELQSAVLATQRQCEQLRRETEEKCAQLLQDAQKTAEQNRAEAAVSSEEQRLADAKEASAAFLDDMEKRLTRQLELLAELREREALPARAASKPQKPERPAIYDFDAEPEEERPAQAEAPAQEDLSQTKKIETLHGTFPPEKQRIFDELGFGKARETTE